MQRATSLSGANAADVATGSLASLAINATTTRTFSYTFPLTDAGTTRYLRICADMDSAADTGDITELAEDDNCGPWTAVTVLGQCTVTSTCDCTDPDDEDCSGSPSLTCAASASSVDVNVPVTFTATPLNGATSPYEWRDAASGALSGTTNTITRSWSAPGGPYATQVRATNPSGGFTSWKTCTPNVTVGTVCTAGDLTLAGAPTRVVRGGTSTLTYEIPGVTNSVESCIITSNKDSSYNVSIPISTCTTEVDGEAETHAIVTQTTFTLTCGSETTETTIDVVPDIEET